MKKFNVLMLLVSVFFLFNCRTELEVNEQTSDKDTGKGKLVSFQTMQIGLGNVNIQKEFRVTASSLSKTTELTDFVIDENKIIAVENSPSDIHYSMVVYPKIPKEKNVFYNLMVRKRNGEISKIIYKYTPDKDWFNDYNKKIHRMYRGEIDFIYKEGNFSEAALSKSASCYEQFLEIPCEFGYYHDDAHCESTGSTMIKVTICQDMGGSPTISYGSDSGSSNGSGGSGGTPITPISLEEPLPNGNEYNNAYQAFKVDRRFSFDERQWLSLYRNESLNLFWYTYNMADQNKAFALAKKYMQFAIAGQNTGFNSIPFSWIMNFITINPDVTAIQFKNWFLTDIQGNFLEQIILEDPSTILNYETLSSPNFKMRRLDQIKYPRFTQIVKDLKSYVQNNPLILNKLVEISGMSKNQVLDKLTFGQGPQIELIPGLKYKNDPVFGLFNSTTSEILYINENFTLGLQQASTTSTIEATSFLMAVTMLHEFVHYGNYLTGFDPDGDESGELFENSVYGMIINRVTAGQYILKFKNK
ncbi:hypothetical protein [Chryseobacterium sp. JM1]|uniref:hypothetical protein n=1 Tax=Chryseobacterium sp. JM1 TaxID=1233950 RepID=UPI0004E6A26B|nr:hypothetical protein [Chryseobacterium sp. JM1]KFF17190.1 hypothetical protein IW22_21345 [Chryseobacterium sp. JM1]